MDGTLAHSGWREGIERWRRERLLMEQRGDTMDPYSEAAEEPQERREEGDERGWARTELSRGRRSTRTLLSSWTGPAWMGEEAALGCPAPISSLDLRVIDGSRALWGAARC